MIVYEESENTDFNNSNSRENDEEKEESKQTQFKVRKCKINMENFNTVSSVETLKLGLSPRNKHINSKKPNLRIQVEYDDEDKAQISNMLSFSPINKHSKNIPVKSKLSFNSTIKSEISIFSNLLKKSCKTLTLNNLQETTGKNSLYELSKVAQEQGKSNVLINLKPVQKTKLIAQELIEEDSASSDEEESKEASQKTFSQESIKRVGSTFNENSMIYYVEEDQFLNELDENFKKFYVSAVDNFLGNYNVYITNSLMLISLLPEISYFQQEIEKKKVEYKFCNFKRLLILDLDETLVHTDFDYKFDKHDVYLKMTTDDGIENTLPINLRPHLKEFLEFSSKYFDIVAFTASCKEYADIVLDYLDPENKYFKARLYRESCVIYKNLYLKFIEIFNKNPKDILIIENSMFSFSYSLKNGILLTSYYDDKEDQDLVSIMEFMEAGIIHTPDVRDVVESTFEFCKIKSSLKEISFEEMQKIEHYKD